jgi:hypothetical protein
MRCHSVGCVRRAKRNHERNRLRKHRSRSHDAVIRVYDESANVIETHEHWAFSKNRSGASCVRAGFGVSPTTGPEAAQPPARADWDRLGALAVLESALFVESVSLSPNRDCWQRNCKAVRIGVNRAADVLPSFFSDR